MYRNIPFKKIIEDKPISSYPDYVINEIKLISINKNNSFPIGSYSYKAAKYPSDIDIFEIVNRCCNKESVIKLFISGIRDIVRNISNSKWHWFLELKAGIDEQFNLDLNDPNFIEWINDLFKKQLLPQDEYNKISSLMMEGTNIANEMIQKILRSHYIVRWSMNDIFNGFKILPGGINLTLEDALTHKSQINIELLAIVNNKITDLSNYFVLVFTDSSGKEMAVNLPQSTITDFINYFKKNLQLSMKKLYYSELDYDYLKLVKRYWSYGRFTKDQKLINKLVPILNSNIALAGQLKSEIATIIKLLENIPLSQIPIEILRNQLSFWKSRLTHVLEIPDDLEFKIDTSIDKIVNNQLDNEEIIDILSPIKERLVKIINENVLQYLMSVGLAPPPDYLFH
jgi:hypothetical protein